MRQYLGTILIVSALMALNIHACAEGLGLCGPMPLFRMLLIVVLAVYVIYHGDLNRKEYEAQKRKIRRAKLAKLREAQIVDEDSYRRTRRASEGVEEIW